MRFSPASLRSIIPQQETSGNYNLWTIQLLDNLLYHNKRHQGTTTNRRIRGQGTQLYHNKRHQGTTTFGEGDDSFSLLYHNKRHQGTTTGAAPKLHNAKLYHNKRHQGTTTRICSSDRLYDYPTTRDIRELQQAGHLCDEHIYYTTTRDIRELQPARPAAVCLGIIPQQETSGNYNWHTR